MYLGLFLTSVINRDKYSPNMPRPIKIEPFKNEILIISEAHPVTTDPFLKYIISTYSE